MTWFKSKKTVAVHDSNFHPDDVFAVALLSVLYDSKIKVNRTRDEKIIASADFVLDVGCVYDPEKNRFDHHQAGGAGLRANKIAYSSFGLLWKKYGAQVCESEEAANILEKRLVEVVDADDCGFKLSQPTLADRSPFLITDFVYSLRPTWKERGADINKFFFRAVDFAKNILKREIEVTRDQLEIAKIIKEYYLKSLDKRLVIIDSPKVSRYEIWNALQDFPEPLFAVYGSEGDWAVVAMRKEKDSFNSRKLFPANWSGLRDDELVNVTGVIDAVFCLNTPFLVGAKSKEGAIKLAKLALEN